MKIKRYLYEIRPDKFIYTTKETKGWFGKVNTDRKVDFEGTWKWLMEHYPLEEGQTIEESSVGWGPRFWVCDTVTLKGVG